MHLPEFTVVVPARSGSRRIVDKNIQRIDGRSLIQITLEFAEQLGAQEVVLSSDSKHYLEHSKGYGNVVRHFRERRLSGDSVSSRNVVSALFEEKLIRTSFAVLLQPTSPFRIKETLEKAILLAVESKKNVYSVSEFKKGHPDWAMVTNEAGLLTLPADFNVNSQSQNLSRKYYLNGNFYVYRKDLLTKDESTRHSSIGFICNSDFEAVDIDSPFDLLVARRISMDFFEN